MNMQKKLSNILKKQQYTESVRSLLKLPEICVVICSAIYKMRVKR